MTYPRLNIKRLRFFLFIVFLTAGLNVWSQKLKKKFVEHHFTSLPLNPIGEPGTSQTLKINIYPSDLEALGIQNTSLFRKYIKIPGFSEESLTGKIVSELNFNGLEVLPLNLGIIEKKSKDKNGNVIIRSSFITETIFRFSITYRILNRNGDVLDEGIIASVIQEQLFKSPKYSTAKAAWNNSKRDLTKEMKGRLELLLRNHQKYLTQNYGYASSVERIPFFTLKEDQLKINEGFSHLSKYLEETTASSRGPENELIIAKGIWLDAINELDYTDKKAIKVKEALMYNIAMLNLLAEDLKEANSYIKMMQSNVTKKGLVNGLMFYQSQLSTSFDKNNVSSRHFDSNHSYETKEEIYKDSVSINCYIRLDNKVDKVKLCYYGIETIHVYNNDYGINIGLELFTDDMKFNNLKVKLRDLSNGRVIQAKEATLLSKRKKSIVYGDVGYYIWNEESFVDSLRIEISHEETLISSQKIKVIYGESLRNKTTEIPLKTRFGSMNFTSINTHRLFQRNNEDYLAFFDKSLKRFYLKKLGGSHSNTPEFWSYEFSMFDSILRIEGIQIFDFNKSSIIVLIGSDEKLGINQILSFRLDDNGLTYLRQNVFENSSGKLGKLVSIGIRDFSDMPIVVGERKFLLLQGYFFELLMIEVTNEGLFPSTRKYLYSKEFLMDGYHTEIGLLTYKRNGNNYIAAVDEFCPGLKQCQNLVLYGIKDSIFELKEPNSKIILSELGFGSVDELVKMSFNKNDYLVLRSKEYSDSVTLATIAIGNNDFGDVNISKKINWWNYNYRSSYYERTINNMGFFTIDGDNFIVSQINVPNFRIRFHRLTKNGVESIDNFPYFKLLRASDLSYIYGETTTCVLKKGDKHYLIYAVIGTNENGGLIEIFSCEIDYIDGVLTMKSNPKKIDFSYKSDQIYESGLRIEQIDSDENLDFIIMHESLIALVSINENGLFVNRTFE